jgi:hypothetical protein
MATIPLSMVQAQADMIYAQIKDAAHADTVKMYPNDAFDWSLTDIKDFAAARYTNLQETARELTRRDPPRRRITLSLYLAREAPISSEIACRPRGHTPPGRNAA